MLKVWSVSLIVKSRTLMIPGKEELPMFAAEITFCALILCCTTLWDPEYSRTLAKGSNLPAFHVLSTKVKPGGAGSRFRAGAHSGHRQHECET